MRAKLTVEERRARVRAHAKLYAARHPDRKAEQHLRRRLRGLSAEGAAEHMRRRAEYFRLCEAAAGRRATREYLREHPFFGPYLTQSQRNRLFRKNSGSRPRRLREKYGITVARWEELFRLQGGRCAICQKELHPPRVCTDHCHSTGRVRGLLCNQCNSMLPRNVADHPELLIRAFDYTLPPADDYSI